MNSRVWGICSLGLLASFTLLLSCKGVQKNRTDAYMPQSVDCITPTDPRCTGVATAGVSVPIPEGRQDLARTLTGQCVIVEEGVEGEKPCTGIQLIVRSSRETETQVKTVVVDGLNFRVEELTKGGIYRLEAASDSYEVLNGDRPVRPGSNMKIKLRPKPRP